MRPPHRELPPLGLGAASVVLGAVGLLLFVMPILAIPISACGLSVGAIGALVAVARKSLDVRLSLAGMMLSSTAVALDLAIAYAPSGYSVRPADPSATSPGLPGRYVAPPAPFHGYRSNRIRTGIV